MLGLSLDEITGLVELLDLDECAPVQERLRELLVAKRRDLAEQIAELESLCSELARVADRLGLPASAGACDDSCACFADEAAPVAEMQTVPLGSASATEVPIGCSLDAAARPERLAAWQDLMAHVVERVDVADEVRLRFGAGVSAAEVADLAAKEQGCCSFFRFKVGIADGETTLDIAAPPEASEVVEALLFRS